MIVTLSTSPVLPIRIPIIAGISLPAVADDIYASAEGEVEVDYHYLERGHWTNGPVDGDFVVDPDTVEVEECFVRIPLIDRVFGPYLGESLTALLLRGRDSEIHERVSEVIAEQASDMEWD